MLITRWRSWTKWPTLILSVACASPQLQAQRVAPPDPFADKKPARADVFLPSPTDLTAAEATHLPAPKREAALALLKSEATLTKGKQGGITRAAFSFVAVNDTHFELLQHFPELEAIWLRVHPGGKNELTDAGVQSLTSLKKLKHVELNGAKLQGTGLVDLARLPALEELHLSQMDLSPDSLKVLQSFPSLRTLGLMDWQITRDHLAAVAGIPGLRELYLNGSLVREDSLQALSRATQLESILLVGTSVGDGVWPHLLTLRSLKWIALNRTHISTVPDAIAERLPELRRLTLSSTRVDDSSLAAICGLRKLTLLQIDNTLVSGRQLDELSALEHLEGLTIGSRACSEEDLVNLATVLSKLKRLAFVELHALDSARLRTAFHNAVPGAKVTVYPLSPSAN